MVLYSHMNDLFYQKQCFGFHKKLLMNSFCKNILMIFIVVFFLYKYMLLYWISFIYCVEGVR